MSTVAVLKSTLPPKVSDCMYVKFELSTRRFTVKAYGLMDTGANVCLIEKDMLPDDVAQELTPCETPVQGIGGESGILGSVSGMVKLGDAQFLDMEFQVVDKLLDDVKCILGTNILMNPKLNGYTVDIQSKKIVFNFKNASIPRTVSYCTKVNWADKVVTCHGVKESENSKSVDTLPKFESLRDKLEYLKKEYDIPLYHEDEKALTKFADMLLANLSIFGNEGELGCFPTPIAIETQGEPVNVRQHPIAKQFEPLVQAEIDKMIKTGVVRKCVDPKGWNSPIIVVGKKDKTARVCANFKNTINKRLCRPDPFPAPAIEEIFNSIEDGNKYFSSMDLQSGYWQLEIREEDKHKTAFTWNRQCLEFNKMPFGYTAAGASFSRAIATALNSVDFDRKKVKDYIDDICIMGEEIDNFIDNHLAVFKALKDFNLRLKARKCFFLRVEIPFLGRYISAQGMRPIPEYVQGIMNIKAPKNLTELKQAQGRLTWINTFIGTRMGEMVKNSSFSQLMEPILKIARRKPFKWTEEADKALETIKERMTRPPFISFADPNLPFVLITDASEFALGGILCQTKNGEYRVIGTVSKCFSDTERRWSTTEREAYSILYCVKKFTYFLERNHFTVFTDHKSLTYMDRKTFNNSKISRWQYELSQYSFHVQYLEG